MIKKLLSPYACLFYFINLSTMNIKTLQTGLCTYHNIVMLIQSNQDAFEHIFLIGFLPKTGQYQAVMFVYQTDPISSLRQILKVLGTFKTFVDARASVLSKVSRGANLKKIYTPGILGLARFLQGFYLVYVTTAEAVGQIGEHQVYQILETNSIPLFTVQKDSTQKDEIRHKQLFDLYGFENVYYSLTYDLSQSLCHNLCSNRPCTPEESFEWNSHISNQISTVIGKSWTLTCIHGYYNQISRVYWEHHKFDIVIVARRSRHHCGTRYLKRGIDEKGNAANFVESEQIVVCHGKETLSCASYVQVRGSAPVYWLQRPSMLVSQPSIQIVHSDKGFLGTQKHFATMMERYGRPILCTNLMRKMQSKPRQTLLTSQYHTALTSISCPSLPYFQFDMKAHLKMKDQGKSFHQNSDLLAYYSLLCTGIFVAKPSPHGQIVNFQNGVIRFNCVDCIDRTNEFQTIQGKMALGVQMRVLAGKVYGYRAVSVDQKIQDVYAEIYEDLGNTVSLQYAGSEAHRKKVGSHESGLMLSLKRHYSNNVTDYERQALYDIFLGNFSLRPPYLYQEPPPIAHQPDRRFLSKFEQQNWFEVAYKKFKEQYSHILSIPHQKVEPCLGQSMMHEFREEHLKKETDISGKIRKQNIQVEYMGFLVKTNRNLGIVVLNEQSFTNMLESTKKTEAYENSEPRKMEQQFYTTI